MSSSDLKQRIVEVARLMYQRFLTNSAGGNISVRLGDRIYITPKYAGSRYLWNLQPEQINVLNLAYEVVEGAGDISRESRLHLAVYDHFPEAGAVIHAHPFFATASAVAEKAHRPHHRVHDESSARIESCLRSRAHSQRMPSGRRGLAPRRTG